MGGAPNHPSHWISLETHGDLGVPGLKKPSDQRTCCNETIRKPQRKTGRCEDTAVPEAQACKVPQVWHLHGWTANTMTSFEKLNL